MAEPALTQNLQLANALTAFSKTLFGSAPATVTTSEEGGTTVKGTSLTPEAINAMLREMTEGGLSGNGSGGIAGLAAIMSGQKSAGLYNSPTTMQLMNKNATNIAERAALASAQTTTTTTPKKSTQVQKQPGMLSTPAGQIGLILGGASLLKNKKFRKTIGLDSADEVAAAMAPQTIEGFNQSVAADASDYIGTSINESVSAIESSSIASMPQVFDGASEALTSFVSSGGGEAITSAISDLSSGLESTAIEAGSELLSESGSAVADIGADSGDLLSGITDFFDWFADGGIVRSYADGGIVSSERKLKGRDYSAMPLISDPLLNTGPIASIIPRKSKKPIDPFADGSMDGFLFGSTINDGGAPGSGIGTDGDSVGTGVATSLSGAISGSVMGGIIGIAAEIAEGIANGQIGGNQVAVEADAVAAANAANPGPVGNDAEGPAPEGGNTAANDAAGNAAAAAAPAADGDAGDAGWNDGGSINGPGTGTSDSIVARLSDGEYVIPADVVKKMGEDFFDNLLDMHHTPAAVQKRRA